jgi:hypothetical protein
VNPWGLLRRDLLAVLASLRLELWQLWRRNRQGELPRPEFWPPALAGWFWPLLLALLLSLLLAAGWGLRSPAPGVTAPAAPAAEASDSGDPPPAELPLVEPPPVEPPPVELPPVGVPPLGPPPAEDAPAGEPQEVADLPGPDPLLEAFASESGAALLQAARLREPDGELELVLDPSGWQGLPAAERQRLAEQWQLRAESLGSARLGLLDSQGTPLARSARVGSGMILLAPLTPADAP